MIFFQSSHYVDPMSDEIKTPKQSIEESDNNSSRSSQSHYLWKLIQTIVMTPVSSTIHLACRAVKLITWDICKSYALRLLGYHNDADSYFESQYLKTVMIIRDILFIPTTAYSIFKDLTTENEEFADDRIEKFSQQSYLSTECTQKFELFSSSIHGCKKFNVVKPKGITAFSSESDGNLKAVKASHFLEPGVMAINFGLPNVAAFTTEAMEDGSIQTIKVDAKSLKREPMTYHPTNGTIQSGVFFVPTNLPDEALERFKEAAEELEGESNITCVNTNCRVLKKAGFSIEGRDLDDVIFPTTMMEHFLFRNVFYTDSAGEKCKVHFDIVNTTEDSLEKYFQKIDIAVLGTRLRHLRRHADTEENRKIRGAAAKAIVAEEKERLAALSESEQATFDLTRREVTVSVPSFLGDVISRIWGRHTIYEMDISDKKERILEAFEEMDLEKLYPFPDENPSFVTKLKRDYFFSQPMINLLYRHMMGKADTLHLNTQDLFEHLKSTNGERLNYVILEDKVILARVKVNGESNEAHLKAADWALSKHALLARRQGVLCSGEMWYDESDERFKMNSDSGTYKPTEDHVHVAVDLANEIFSTSSGDAFEFAETEDK